MSAKEKAEEWVNARIEEDDPFFWQGELAVGYMAGYRAALRDAQDIIASSYSSNHVANYHYLCAWLNSQIQETAKELGND